MLRVILQLYLHGDVTDLIVVIVVDNIRVIAIIVVVVDGLCVSVAIITVSVIVIDCLCGVVIVIVDVSWQCSYPFAAVVVDVILREAVVMLLLSVTITIVITIL